MCIWMSPKEQGKQKQIRLTDLKRVSVVWFLFCLWHYPFNIFCSHTPKVCCIMSIIIYTVYLLFIVKYVSLVCIFNHHHSFLMNGLGSFFLCFQQIFNTYIYICFLISFILLFVIFLLLLLHLFYFLSIKICIVMRENWGRRKMIDSTNNFSIFLCVYSII